MFGGYIIFASFGLEILYGLKNTAGMMGAASIAVAALLSLLFVGYFLFLLLRPQYFG